MNENSIFQFRDNPLIDPEKLAIRKGDTVLYENVQYKVMEAGMRWLRVERLDTPGVEFSVKKNYVVKIFPETQEANGAAEVK